MTLVPSSTPLTTGKEVIRTCDTLALNDCKMANKVMYCYCNGDLCNSRPASSFSIDDQSNYDASDADGGPGSDEDDDYGDEFSGMSPTEPLFPEAAGPFAGNTAAGGGRGRSTPGLSWSTAGGGQRGQNQGMNANSHIPFHPPAAAATVGPIHVASSASGSGLLVLVNNSRSKGLVPLLLAQSGTRLLIVIVLSVVLRHHRLDGWTLLV